MHYRTMKNRNMDLMISLFKTYQNYLSYMKRLSKYSVINELWTEFYAVQLELLEPVYKKLVDSAEKRLESFKIRSNDITNLISLFYTATQLSRLQKIVDQTSKEASPLLHALVRVELLYRKAGGEQEESSRKRKFLEEAEKIWSDLRDLGARYYILKFFTDTRRGMSSGRSAISKSDLLSSVSSNKKSSHQKYPGSVFYEEDAVQIFKNHGRIQRRPRGHHTNSFSRISGRKSAHSHKKLIRSMRKSRLGYFGLSEKLSIVGRKEEREYITTLLRTIKKGEEPEYDIILFRGPPGCGITLMSSFACTLAERENCCDVSVSRLFEGYKEVPCAAWRPIFADLLFLDSLLGKTKGDFERHVCELFATEPTLRAVPVERMHFLNYFVPVKFEEDVHNIDTLLGRREAIAQLCLTVIKWSCESSGLLLVFDNVQWIDCTSWFALTRVIHSGIKGLVCILTVAEEKEPVELQALRSSIQVKDFQLQNFRERDTQRHLCDIFSAQKVDKALCQHVLKESGGNPLFIETLASSMKAQGYVHVNDGVLITSKLKDLEHAQQSIVSLYELEASYLDPRSYQVALLCSLMSSSITAEVVATVLVTSQDILKIGKNGHLRVTVDAAEGILRKLVGAGFLCLAGVGATGEKQYLLAHEDIRQAFVGKLSPKQLKRIHENVAKALIKAASTQHSQFHTYAIIGKHWLLAERDLKALELWQKAVSLTERTGALIEAMALLERIFALLKVNDTLLDQFGKVKAANLHIKMAMMLCEKGVPDASYSHFFEGKSVENA